MSNQTVVLSQEQAEILLAEWQKILKLQDWEIVIDIKRARDMVMDPPGDAEVTWLEEKKTAVIRLLDPVDFDPNSPTPQNHERSIIHELLHLHMVPFDAAEDTPAGIAQEQAIHAISTALVELKRRGDIDEPG